MEIRVFASNIYSLPSWKREWERERGRGSFEGGRVITHTFLRILYASMWVTRPTIDSRSAEFPTSNRIDGERDTIMDRRRRSEMSRVHRLRQRYRRVSTMMASEGRLRKTGFCWRRCSRIVKKDFFIEIENWVRKIRSCI